MLLDMNKVYDMFGVDTNKEVQVGLDAVDKLITLKVMNNLDLSETTVDVLLDKTTYESKPQKYEIGNITEALVKNRTTLTVNELANYISNGCSFKVSVMGTTKKDSFISSNIVALEASILPSKSR